MAGVLLPTQKLQHQNLNHVLSTDPQESLGTAKHAAYRVSTRTPAILETRLEIVKRHEFDSAETLS